MKKNTFIISIVIIIIVFMLIGIYVYFKLNKKNDNIDNNVSNIIENAITSKEEIIDNQGLEADENIYEKTTEYDGRETVKIKDNIQFDVALSGILNRKEPKLNNIEDEIKNKPTKNGIWVSEDSRAKFLEILNEITNSKYKVNDEGYLIQEEKNNDNEFDTKISKILNSDNLIIFDINSTCYTIDEVTGSIEEYPFEDMDIYDEYEYFVNNNEYIFFISQNNYGKISQSEVLKNLLNSFGKKL